MPPKCILSHFCPWTPSSLSPLNNPHFPSQYTGHQPLFTCSTPFLSLLTYVIPRSLCRRLLWFRREHRLSGLHGKQSLICGNKINRISVIRDSFLTIYFLILRAIFITNPLERWRFSKVRVSWLIPRAFLSHSSFQFPPFPVLLPICAEVTPIKEPQPLLSSFLRSLAGQTERETTRYWESTGTIKRVVLDI